jgi:hypothetical protein
MANEGSYQVQLGFAKGNFASFTRASGAKNFDVTGTHCIYNVQAVGFAAAEALLLGDVASPGVALFHNMSATNYVEIYDSSGGAAVLKLLPGEWAGPMRFSVATPAAKANTTSVDLEYWIIET